MRLGWLIVAGGLCAAPVVAQDREYCPSRPGLGTTPCTISPGRVSLETALADWTRDEDTDQREDTVLIGDSEVRIGLTDRVEALFGWTPFGHDRIRDKTSGSIDQVEGVGGITLGVKANLHNPDGSGFSAAMLGSVMLPTGRQPIGSATWSAAFLAPMSVDLSDALNLQFTPEVDAAADEDGAGRHLAYSGTLGLGVAVTDAVTLTLEAQALRDRDPGGHMTQRLGAVSLAWMTSDDTQLDVGANLALDDAAPDHEFYVGVSHRF